MALAGWRWLFIIEGAVSFMLGLAAFFLLPDFPGSTTGSAKWLLNDEERRVAASRITRDVVSDQESNHGVWHGLKLAVKDIRVWIFALIMCSNQSTYGSNYFYPEIVKGLGLGSRTITLVCTAPPYLVDAFVSFFICWSSDRRAERGYHIICSVVVAVIGFIISAASTSVPVRYVSSFLYIAGVFGANPVVFSWAAYTVSRTPEKRACAMAIINIVGQLGSIWSPFFFRSSEQPRYLTAMVLLIAFCGFEVLLCLTMKFLLSRANKKLKSEYEGTDRTPNLFVL